MSYPISPFPANFNPEILFKAGNYVSKEKIEEFEFGKLGKWLCTSPKISSYRVNSHQFHIEYVFKLIQEELIKISLERNCNVPKVYIHEVLPDVIIVEGFKDEELDLGRRKSEVIVDVHCGAAVLRGSHIFAPGIIGMTSGTKLGEKVSIYADLEKKCKKGFQKIYEGKKVFLGNGVVKMTRNQLFGENLQLSGVAVELMFATSGCPPLGEHFLPEGSSMLQNIPSVVCVDVLNPLANETILDMCASPGNKTTHIAAKMHNKGILLAIDKTPTKVNQLKSTCEKFGARVEVFQADSTKIFVNEVCKTNLLNGPPFRCESFDKILLDAPCSALGKRPQLLNADSEKVIKSHVPLQRKLFTNAVNLLKVNGVLVYSTCTVTLAENEGIVSWALKTFDCIRLVKAEPTLGGKGWPVEGLDNEQQELVQRFGPDQKVDSVGFFIAKFIKIKQVDLV